MSMELISGFDSYKLVITATFSKRVEVDWVHGFIRPVSRYSEYNRSYERTKLRTMYEKGFCLVGLPHIGNGPISDI